MTAFGFVILAYILLSQIFAFQFEVPGFTFTVSLIRHFRRRADVRAGHHRRIPGANPPSQHGSPRRISSENRPKKRRPSPHESAADTFGLGFGAFWLTNRPRAPSQLDDRAAECLLASCREQEIDCLTCLVDCADKKTITAVQARGFDLVDIRLTLDAPCAPAPSHAPFGRHSLPPEPAGRPRAAAANRRDELPEIALFSLTRRFSAVQGRADV